MILVKKEKSDLLPPSVSCHKIGEKTYVATQGSGGKHDFVEKYTPLGLGKGNFTSLYFKTFETRGGVK